MRTREESAESVARPTSGGDREQAQPSLTATIAVIVALLAAYYGYLGWMLGEWWKSEYYSHGALIPVISGYIVYRLREQLMAVPDGTRLGGLGVIAGSLLLYLLATRLDINFVQGFAFVGTIWGLIWWLRGWPLARALAFPVAYLLFMVPIARLLVDVFALPLQLRSAQLAGAAAQMIGMDVVPDGTSLHIPGYTFEVAIACSGLKSAIAMSALGALVAYLADATTIRRVILFACSIPIALVANAIRIWLTLVLGATIGPAAAEGFFHKASGIVVFLIALGGLLLVGRALGCRAMREDI